MYREFTEKNVFEQLTLAVACSASCENNENTVNLKIGVYIVNMLLNEHLTWVHSQKDPRLHFGESFTLKSLCQFCHFHFKGT